MIERVLQAHRPDQWRPLTAAELKSQRPSHFCAGWRVELPADSVLIDGVDYLLVVIDQAFPNSQPRILAPQAGKDYKWPHIESYGLLCLKSTRLTSDPGERVLQHLWWAHELLNYSEKERRCEFEREFAAYWDHYSSDKKKQPKVFSLLKPSRLSREVVYIKSRFCDRIIVADDRGELITWLRNSGINLRDKDILPTWLLNLPRPPIPDQYPETGRDVLNLLPEQTLKRILIPGQPCPIFFEARTPTGPTFAAVILHGATKSELVKGFRRLDRVPFNRVVASFNTHRVQRCPVARVDGRWIHGRDRDQDFPAMRSKSVAIIGCGAIGAALARLLAQSGIGKFLLFDPDDLVSANIARHILGMRYVGQNKAQATAQMLREDFPQLKSVMICDLRFENLNSQILEEISQVDLIISAGIDFDGDASLDVWRRTLAIPPPHLCTWIEAFAIVGHAILIYGNDSLLTGFDDDEQPTFRLTDWPEESNILVVEAGCGNVFQPHGGVDLQSTIVLAARLAVDVLLGKVPVSCRRVWQGDLEAVTANGGIARPQFTESRVVKEAPWL